MSRKGTSEAFQTKTTRNDRFAQMSHQEKIIEQKKKEIQTRLEQKQKGVATSSTDSKTTSTSKQTKSPSKWQEKKIAPTYNIFSNDGSFLDQFKQLKEKKLDQKLKSYKSSQERSFNDERGKSSKWSQRRRSPSPKDNRSKPRISRFSDKPPQNEPKINISTSYSNLISQANFNIQPISPQNVIGQPLLKSDIPPPGVVFPTAMPTSAAIIAAPPVMLSVPPLQVMQNSVAVSIVVPPRPSQNVLASNPNVTSLPPPVVAVNLPPPTQNITLSAPITISASNSVGMPPPPCIATVELASIPPPNPIQVENIPQPEPINALNIPPPAPLQLQNIPPPSPIQLNEIPNPKPMDLLNIPTPGNSCLDKNMMDSDFIKNIPPPNKSVPPPSLPDAAVNVNINLPPPSSPSVVSPVPTSLPPPNILPPTSMPPPQPISNAMLSQNAIQNLLTPQSIMVHSIPPPQNLQNLTVLQAQGLQTLTNLTPAVPPPPPPPQTSMPPPVTISITVLPPVTGSNGIPPLMAQPVLPPPGIGVVPPPVNINCPPPTVLPQTISLQGPLANFLNPPPLTSQMPPMNIPPPTSMPLATAINTFKDLNAVCPPGTAEYEAMASLGRMVAQCGSGIEDIVRQRKPQDPNLWFLFHKESAMYRQYQQLVQQFIHEIGRIKEEHYKPEDIYEPEMATDDDFEQRNFEMNDMMFGAYDFKLKMENSDIKMEEDTNSATRRKRKSRWGDKTTSIPPPMLVMNGSFDFNLPPNVAPLQGGPPTGSIILSKITRNDPALVQYALNTFGTTSLNDDEWKKAEDHFKINVLYQEMLKKRQQMDRLLKWGKNNYEYDSDEEMDGGTWEHKLREKEMVSTQDWATELTKHAEGKHHIGDFLPPDEFKRFMEKNSIKQELLSDYQEQKLKEDNIGFKMLQKLGWSEGQGLGADGSGIVEPINKANLRDQNQGLGLSQPNNVEDTDDEYDAYRKRMMLAYRFRPNPLNNPRRPYY